MPIMIKYYLNSAIADKKILKPVMSWQRHLIVYEFSGKKTLGNVTLSIPNYATKINSIWYLSQLVDVVWI